MSRFPRTPAGFGIINPNDPRRRDPSFIRVNPPAPTPQPANRGIVERSAALNSSELQAAFCESALFNFGFAPGEILVSSQTAVDATAAQTAGSKYGWFGLASLDIARLGQEVGLHGYTVRMSPPDNRAEGASSINGLLSCPYADDNIGTYSPGTGPAIVIGQNLPSTVNQWQFPTDVVRFPGVGPSDESGLLSAGQSALSKSLVLDFPDGNFASTVGRTVEAQSFTPLFQRLVDGVRLDAALVVPIGRLASFTAPGGTLFGRVSGFVSISYLYSDRQMTA